MLHSWVVSQIDPRKPDHELWLPGVKDKANKQKGIGNFNTKTVLASMLQGMMWVSETSKMAPKENRHFPHFPYTQVLTPILFHFK